MSVEIWRTYDAMEARLSAPLSERMLDLAGVGPGMRVLDLATGRGEPAIRAAHRVGPTGVVVGVDADGDVLAMAKERAAREGLSNLELRVADAAALAELPASYFHAATVRWGLMYMASPVVALMHVRRVLAPDAVLVAALWAEPERVPYHTLPRRVLEAYGPVPAIDFNAPGVFRYASPERISSDFAEAGLHIEHVEEMDVPVVEAEDAADVIEWTRAFGLARLLQALPEQSQRAWESDMTSALEARRTGGVIRLGGVTRLVVARAAPRITPPGA